ncbi:amidohydrolase family protein [Actinoplanes solisilvae]|uniref:amidohydrolase family protein n=1 Tax=Actinoplanes solisilvae TaxID=2486853 RepID=UPI000FD6C41A|nr:amidohydrolase [Actinoplanes solisilvae]
MEAKRAPLRLRAPIVIPCDNTCTVLRDAVVDIGADGRIKNVSTADDAPAWTGGVRTMSGILLPGLVNAHAHSSMSVLRGRGGDLPLISWLQEAMWPAEALMTAADIRAGSLLSSIEMLRNGVTTTSEMYFHVDQQAEAVLQAGGRAVLAEAVLDLPGQEPWRAVVDRISSRIDATGLRLGPDERIEFAYGPHSAYVLPPEALRTVGEHARTRGALVHIHLAETELEDQAQRALFGSVPALLESVGLLESRLLVAHAVHLSDADIGLLTGAGVAVAHCPSSNAKLGSGVMRLSALRAAGVPVGLGTDGPASNDRLDLLGEARTAALLARVTSQDPTAVTAADALLLATRGGAAALGRDDIGALEAGRWADLVHIGVDDPAFATGLDVPDEELVANLVWAAGSRTVTDVWVAGEVVVAGSESVRVDRRQAQADVTAAASRLRVPAPSSATSCRCCTRSR